MVRGEVVRWCVVRGEGWAACAAAVEEKLDTAASIALPYKTSTRPGGSTCNSMVIVSIASIGRIVSIATVGMAIVSIATVCTRAAAPAIVCV